MSPATPEEPLTNTTAGFATSAPAVRGPSLAADFGSTFARNSIAATPSPDKDEPSGSDAAGAEVSAIRSAVAALNFPIAAASSAARPTHKVSTSLTRASSESCTYPPETFGARPGTARTYAAGRHSTVWSYTFAWTCFSSLAVTSSSGGTGPSLCVMNAPRRRCSDEPGRGEASERGYRRRGTGAAPF